MNNLNLCLDHKQEWKQSHYASHNCDHCKLQKENEELKHLLGEAGHDLIFLVEELKPRVSGSFWNDKFKAIINKHKLEHYFGETK